MARRSLLILLALALLAPACRRPPGDEEEAALAVLPERVDARGRVLLTAEEREALGIETTTARTGDMAIRALRFGTVVARPQEEAVVVAPVTARLATPPAVALGSAVQAGDTLLAIEPLVEMASLASLQAQHREIEGRIHAAEARQKALRQKLDQTTALAAEHLVTEARHAQAEAELKAEQATVGGLRRAAAALGQAKGGRLVLQAPLAGTLATLRTDTGAVVQQGEILARVVRDGPRWIDLTVPPDDETGSSYRVRLAAAALPARLIARGTIAAADGTRRDRLEVAPPGSNRLLPERTVAVEVVRTHRGVLVPGDAVVTWRGAPAVFVEVQAGRFAARAVKLGARSRSTALVASGLAAGETVVTRGAMALLGELGRAALHKR